MAPCKENVIWPTISHEIIHFILQDVMSVIISHHIINFEPNLVSCYLMSCSKFGAATILEFLIELVVFSKKRCILITNVIKPIASVTAAIAS